MLRVGIEEPTQRALDGNPYGRLWRKGSTDPSMSDFSFLTGLSQATGKEEKLRSLPSLLVLLLPSLHMHKLMASAWL